MDDLREHVAKAIYAAAFMPANEEQAARRVPSPGWCWERTSEDHRQFARRQAAAAIAEIHRYHDAGLQKTIAETRAHVGLPAVETAG